MVINIDCFKDILIFLANNINYKEFEGNWIVQSVNMDNLYNAPTLSMYKKEDIMYSVVKLDECNFIKIEYRYPKDKPYIEQCNIEDVTFAGHQFIDTVQEPSIWEKTKSIAKKVGNYTVNFLEDTAREIAIQIAKQVITTQLR